MPDVGCLRIFFYLGKDHCPLVASRWAVWTSGCTHWLWKHNCMPKSHPAILYQYNCLCTSKATPFFLYNENRWTHQVQFKCLSIHGHLGCLKLPWLDPAATAKWITSTWSMGMSQLPMGTSSSMKTCLNMPMVITSDSEKATVRYTRQQLN